MNYLTDRDRGVQNKMHMHERVRNEVPIMCQEVNPLTFDL